MLTPSRGKEIVCRERGDRRDKGKQSAIVYKSRDNFLVRTVVLVSSRPHAKYSLCTEYGYKLKHRTQCQQCLALIPKQEGASFVPEADSG